MEYSGAGGELIHEKNQKQKISWHCPFNKSDTRKSLIKGTSTVHRDEVWLKEVSFDKPSLNGEALWFFGEFHPPLILWDPFKVSRRRLAQLFG